MDRQAIERRDFPIGRRGYDTAAVDAHLRAVAAQFEELQRNAAGGPSSSLASSAGAHVQGIIEAAERSAAEMERSAREAAQELRETAAREAERTREEALEKARTHVAAVARVATALLERVGSMDAEANTLLAGLRTGSGRLAAELASVEANMSELYGAAGGRAPGQAMPQANMSELYGAAGGRAPGEATPAHAAQPVPVAAEPGVTEAVPAASPAAGPAPAEPAPTGPAGAGAPAQLEPVGGEPAASAAPAAAEPAVAQPGPAAPAPPDLTVVGPPAASAAGADIDGARLVALNMALNGETRADTDRFLAENYELPDRTKLVDEVYAAIKG